MAFTFTSAKLLARVPPMEIIKSYNSVNNISGDQKVVWEGGYKKHDRKMKMYKTTNIVHVLYKKTNMLAT